MAADRCPVCGQPLPGLLDATPSQHRHRPPRSRAGVPNRTGVALVAVLCLLVVGIIAATQPSSESEPLPDATEPLPSVPTDAPATPDDLAALVGDHQVAYRSAEGLTLVDPQAPITATRLPVRTSSFLDYFFPLTEMRLIADEQVTIGLLMADHDAIELTDAGSIIRNEFGSFTWLQLLADGEQHVLVSNGSLNLTRIDVPDGARRFDVDGVGVVITTATGTTAIATPRGFEPFHEAPLRALSRHHLIEVACTELFACTARLVDRAGDAAETLPADLADPTTTLGLSPDGAWVVVRRADGTASILEVGTDRLLPLPGDLPSQVAWAPDSSAFVWFDPATTEPLLRIYLPDRGAVRDIDLGDLGAPERVGGAVALVS